MSEDLAWKVISKHLSSSASLVAHQLNSFDDFMRKGMPQVVRSLNPIEVNTGHVAGRGCTQRIRVSVQNLSYARCTTQDVKGNVSLLLPNDARLRNLTYATTVTCDLEVTTTQLQGEEDVTETKTLRGVHLANIPVMVGSSFCNLSDCRDQGLECPFDPTGYFIVSGNEKLVVSHDRINENKPVIFSKTEPLVCEIRSVGEHMLGCPKTFQISHAPRPSPHGVFIVATLNSIRADLPLFTLFRALGILSDREIVEAVARFSRGLSLVEVSRELQGSAAEGSASMILDEETALLYLAKYINLPHNTEPCGTPAGQQQRLRVIRQTLRNDLLPHVGPNFREKATFLALMVSKLLRCRAKLIPPDDRDSYLNKRIDAPGSLLTTLFRQQYVKLMREIRSMLHKEISNGSWRVSGRLINIVNASNVSKIIRASTITAGMTYALSTGVWGGKQARSTKQGVAQVLNRMTYNATISHLRRVNTPIEKTGKLIAPRKLHTTAWGVICPAETPEGASIGLVKNLALTTVITTHFPSTLVHQRLLRLGVHPVEESVGALGSILEKGCAVMLNGRLVGVHTDPIRLTKNMRALKRAGEISPTTGVLWDTAEETVRVNTEAGRCCRPLLIVENGRALIEDLDPAAVDGLMFSELVSGRRRGGGDDINGVIEYVDCDEANQALIAMTHAELQKGDRGNLRRLPYTHLELTPAACLGVVACTIPFINHNQSPRNTYSCAQSKQSLGIYATNFRSRFDTISFVLGHPQRPIVNTRMAASLHVDALPSGSNAIVAIMSYSGYNQEDSLILNKASVERGNFSCTHYRTIKETLSRNQATGEEEVFYKADCPKESLRNHMNPNKVDATGFVPENSFVQGGDVIIGKRMPHRSSRGIEYRDASVAMKQYESGFVDANCFNNNRFPTVAQDGSGICKVRIRQTRAPVVGDKFASRSGQKGCVGAILAEEDMPYTSDGVRPDIIMNPNAIPSRMTVSQILETVMGKTSCMTGEYGDATPFRDRDTSAIGEELEMYGFERFGNEVMYCPSTGLPMKAEILIGPTYYQRLKHMVCDKAHARGSSGPLNSLVRQCSDGRARNGGLRLGGMEVEALMGHCGMSFVKERMYDSADAFRLIVCGQCGCAATVANPEKNIFNCVPCSNKSMFKEVRIPYATKLFLQEIQALGISAHINVA